MNLYNKYILPKFLNRMMETAATPEERKSAVKYASGIVLEIGFGSGLNLPYYKDVTKLYALDPSQELYNMAAARIAAAPFPVEYLKSPAESIPLPEGSVDVIVSTWSLCSIADPLQALKECRRVLKVGGKFLFIEHGSSPKLNLRRWQNVITPFSRLVCGGCCWNRNIEEFVLAAGFIIEDIEKTQEDAPLLYSYSGLAKKRAISII